jgi:uncharacterized protein (DUF2235 family)
MGCRAARVLAPLLDRSAVPIHFLGLWDTVSSVGWAWAPEHFQFTMNNPGVEIVRHAVALDERRVYFVQNLWGINSPTNID